jgi:MFS superfamily sulfate permease-like transporter
MTDDLVKRLRSQIGDDVQEVYLHEPLFALAADRIEALTDQLEDAYARGFCAGQRALKDAGELVTIDSPEIRDRIEALTAKCEALGQEVNMAKYGQPDFAWSIHVEAMAEAKERAEAAEKKLQEMQAHIDHADAYHKAMLAAVAEHARLRAELTKAADSLDWADAHLEDAGVVSANVRYGARDARAALTGNVTVGGGWVDWGASFLPAVPTGKADT